MSDVVVTVPKDRWADWIDEGDLPGQPWGAGDAGLEGWYDFYLGGPMPKIEPGERVYIVAHGRLRGYSPLIHLDRQERSLVRRGGAVAITIPDPIRGFQGWRYRWWDRSAEVPFADWKTAGVVWHAAREEIDRC
jgi:hypothetical protein